MEGECEDINSTPLSVEVKKKWLYTSTPHMPSWRIQGQLYILIPSTAMPVSPKWYVSFRILSCSYYCSACRLTCSQWLRLRHSTTPSLTCKNRIWNKNENQDQIIINNTTYVLQFQTPYLYRVIKSVDI